MIGSKTFAAVAAWVSRAAGRPSAFAACVALVALWAACGPVFGFSDTWQLVVNTGTTIVTFLMVFLIQNSQNRDAAAMQAKLSEIILALPKARNDMVEVERLTEDEIAAAREAQALAAKRGA